MSVMNEQLQRLMRSADQPGVSLRILAPDGPGMVRGVLPTIWCSGPDSGAARQGIAGTGHLRNDASPDGGTKIYPHRITCPMLAMALFGPHRCRDLTPKTTESHWSGGQREP
jgi:hypothetical protein